MKVPRQQREREDFERRVMELQGATPETEQLVRDSAKLDPTLPAPAAAMTRQGTQGPDAHASYQPQPQPNPSGGGATTGQLVRDSSKLDPALPPPDMSAVRAAMSRASIDQSSGSKSGMHSNPVAAAMTDQLVRDSAKLDPSLPPPK